MYDAKINLFQGFKMINENEANLIKAFKKVYKQPIDDPVIDALCEPYYVSHFLTRTEIYNLMTHHNLVKRMKAHDGDKLH